MKKIIISLSVLALLLCVSKAIASDMNLPSGPVDLTPSSTNAVPSKSYVNSDVAKKYSVNIPEPPKAAPKDPAIAELDTMAMNMLKEAEKHNDKAVKDYQMQMIQKGVTHMCPPQIIAKETPQCPPIRVSVNNIEKSGSLCALTCYKYEGKDHEVGYCNK